MQSNSEQRRHITMDDLTATGASQIEIMAAMNAGQTLENALQILSVSRNPSMVVVEGRRSQYHQSVGGISSCSICAAEAVLSTLLDKKSITVDDIERILDVAGLYKNASHLSVDDVRRFIGRYKLALDIPPGFDEPRQITLTVIALASLFKRIEGLGVDVGVVITTNMQSVAVICCDDEGCKAWTIFDSHPRPNVHKKAAFICFGSPRSRESLVNYILQTFKTEGGLADIPEFNFVDYTPLVLSTELASGGKPIDLDVGPIIAEMSIRKRIQDLVDGRQQAESLSKQLSDRNALLVQENMRLNDEGKGMQQQINALLASQQDAQRSAQRMLQQQQLNQQQNQQQFQLNQYQQSPQGQPQFLNSAREMACGVYQSVFPTPQQSTYNKVKNKGHKKVEHKKSANTKGSHDARASVAPVPSGYVSLSSTSIKPALMPVPTILSAPGKYSKPQAPQAAAPPDQAKADEDATMQLILQMQAENAMYDSDLKLARGMEQVIFRCQICLEDEPEDNRFVIGDCPSSKDASHFMCRVCALAYFKSKVNTNEYPIVCIGCTTTEISEGEERRGVVSQDEVLNCLDTLDQELYHKLEKRKNFEALGYKYCRKRDCIGILSLDPGVTQFVCQIENCGESFCAECQEDWHPECTCEQLQEYNREDAEQKDMDVTQLDRMTRRCPQCRMPTHKAGGCYHITCTCGGHWCWGCGLAFARKIIYDHAATCSRPLDD